MILLNNKRIDGVSLDTVPVGTISPFIGLVAPQGYLLCQGQKVSKNRYKQLYNICKSLFGPETETEFYLPDLRGRVIAGLNENDAAMNTIGKILGTYEHNHSTGNHTLTIDEIPTHRHGRYITTNEPGGSIGEWNSNYQYLGTNAWYTAEQNAVGDAGGSQAHNHGNTGLASNYQPTTVMNYIVKAEMVIPNQSTVHDGLDSDSEIDSLSAKQGKILNTKIDSLIIPTVNNTLTSTSTTEALSAAQGKALNDKFGSYVTTSSLGVTVTSPVFNTANNSYKQNGYWEIVQYGKVVWVQGYITCLSVSSGVKFINNLPKPKNCAGAAPHWQFHNWENATPGTPFVVHFSSDGSCSARGGVVGGNYFVQMVYIAE